MPGAPKATSAPVGIQSPCLGSGEKEVERERLRATSILAFSLIKSGGGREAEVELIYIPFAYDNKDGHHRPTGPVCWGLC